MSYGWVINASGDQRIGHIWGSALKINRLPPVPVRVTVLPNRGATVYTRVPVGLLRGAATNCGKRGPRPYHSLPKSLFDRVLRCLFVMTLCAQRRRGGESRMNLRRFGTSYCQESNRAVVVNGAATPTCPHTVAYMGRLELKRSSLGQLIAGFRIGRRC